MKRPWLIWPGIAALTVGASLALAACGGGDDNAADTAGVVAAAAATSPPRSRPSAAR